MHVAERDAPLKGIFVSLAAIRTYQAQAAQIMAWCQQQGVNPRLVAQGQYLTRLAERDRDRICLLDVDEVDWIGIEDEQVMVHVGDQAYPIRCTLTELEARLDPDRFFRAHRSAIVNLDRAQEVIPWFKGSHILRLTTGAEVDLSRMQARALRELLRW